MLDTEVTVTDTYSVEWLNQSHGIYNLSVIMNPSTRLKRLDAKVHYLDELLGDVFANFVGNRFFGYRLRVMVNDRVREIEEHGSFNPAKIVLMLIDIGLPNVFRHKVLDIELSELVYS